MQMIIGGKYADASDGAKKDVLDPGTMKAIDTIPMSTEEDVKRAIAEAKEGQKIWAKVPLHNRIDILRKFHGLFLANKDWFVETAAKEMGKTVGDAEAEVINAATLIDYNCNAAISFMSETFPVGDHTCNETDLTVTIREPHGVVVCILPFNFPFELFNHKVVPALLMGNAVVIKPATETPLCNIKMAELLLEAGVEPKAVNIITGSGSKVGNWLTTNPEVDAVTFTGSTEVGRQIAANCAPNLTPVSLELGGNDAFVVLDDADLDYAVAEAIGGRAYCSGQVCCANKRFLVQNSVKEKFTEKLIAALKEMAPGNQFEEGSSYGPQVSQQAAEDVEGYINETLKQGGKLLLGGKRIHDTMIEPTVIEVTKDMDVAIDMEIFGPVWPIIGFETDEDALAISNASQYGLSGGVITNDINRGMHIAKEMETGTVVVNGGGCYRAPGQPFGGHKSSGIGAEGGVYTLAEMTQIKTIVLRGAYK